jgi:putative membrane protein
VYRLHKYGPINRWSVFFFIAFACTLFAALISPLHAWGRMLFSFHVIQQLLLTLLAAPLLVLSRPLTPFLYALPLSWAAKINREAHRGLLNCVWNLLTTPLVAWLAYAIVLWAWYIPAFFEAALNNEVVHALQHTILLLASALLWWAVIRDRYRYSRYRFAALLLLATALHNAILGALLVWASSVWYPSYIASSLSSPLSPLNDQRLGGIIMLVPSLLAYLSAGFVLVRRIHEADERALHWGRKANGNVMWR